MRKIRMLYSGIQVRDLKRSIRFYRYLGLKVEKQGTMTHKGRWVQLCDPHSRQRLELNWYPKGSKFYEEYRAGSELDHIGFNVDDAVAWYERLIARGFRSAAKPFFDTTDNQMLAYVKDPDGIWIELIGPRIRRDV